MIYALSGCSAVVMVVVQGVLMRAVARARTSATRGVLLSVKFVLWTVFFVLLALADRRALLSGGSVAAGGYLALAIWRMTRINRGE